MKLTHLGLAIDQDLAFENLRSVARRAAEFGNFVRIDMEQSTYTDAALSMYRRLRSVAINNVGTVIQAYLYRSEHDLQSLLPLQPNLRLVKGAYLEPPALAYPRKRDVDANFVRLIEIALQGDGYTAIATHDDAVLERALAFAQRNSIPYDRFEVQMLYGVRPKLHAAMLARGVKVRVAVPFGSQWFPYFMRRLAERPANVLFFLSSMWRG